MSHSQSLGMSYGPSWRVSVAGMISQPIREIVYSSPGKEMRQQGGPNRRITLEK